MQSLTTNYTKDTHYEKQFKQRLLNRNSKTDLFRYKGNYRKIPKPRRDPEARTL